MLNGKVKKLSDYPGWAPNTNSPLNKLANDAHRELFNEDVKITAIHAGLEPGVIGSHYPNLKDLMISVGVEYNGNHSPEEEVLISSVDKTYKWVKQIIKKISE
jgi:dipeptidase D